ncbi:hypothetical protein L227DRAFT_613693 [Lentinus tigrinus ALCF2SS1-6]|uniref:Uncharacterized protein n=1 Tax=Lentinus tigrinus ALCF2SS1-6 TaxID=1328759 RepID=A0A5C2S1R2_9APHY|nr:hypothetical protein L227DRAFT_613693 [Lentinus tigrinus ALCF2SS1-6]
MASLPSRAEYMPSNATFANRHFYLSHDSGHALDTSHVHAALALHAVLVIVCPIHWFLQPKSRLHGLVLTRWEPPSHLFPPRTLKRLPPTDDALDHLGFDSFSSAPAPAPVRTASKSPQPASALDDDWEFGDFTFQPAAAPPRSTKATPISDLLRFDNFVPASSSQQSSSPAPPLSDTPGDFDFGDRGDGLLGDQSDGDDNLGDLGKQIEQLTAVSVHLPFYLTIRKRLCTEAFYRQHAFPSTAVVRTAATPISQHAACRFRSSVYRYRNYSCRRVHHQDQKVCRSLEGSGVRTMHIAEEEGQKDVGERESTGAHHQHRYDVT